MKKYIIAMLFAVIVVGYIAYQKLSGPHIAAPISLTTTPANVTYKDGTYTGPSTDAFYGNVQVQATVSGGKLTDVTFLTFPSDRGQSREINSQAMPYLKQEAIAAQSAQVNSISGATQTSQAFEQSLAAALSQAQG